MAVTTSIKAKGEMRESEADSHNSKLNFFDLKSSLMQLPASDFWPLEISPAIQIGIAGSSGISVRWQHRTNQIFCRFVYKNEISFGVINISQYA